MTTHNDAFSGLDDSGEMREVRHSRHALERWAERGMGDRACENPERHRLEATQSVLRATTVTLPPSKAVAHLSYRKRHEDDRTLLRWDATTAMLWVVVVKHDTGNWVTLTCHHWTSADFDSDSATPKTRAGFVDNDKGRELRRVRSSWKQGGRAAKSDGLRTRHRRMRDIEDEETLAELERYS